MKTQHIIWSVLLVAFAPFLRAESKHTADYILSTPSDYEGKSVTLDVAFVKPVNWKSPVPELAFFHAMTIDTREKKPGGCILVAILAEKSASFAKKYGLNFDDRNDSDTLKGTLIAAPGKDKEHHHHRVWLIDATEGKLAELIAAKKLEINEEDGGPGEGMQQGMLEGSGGPGGPGGPGGRHNHPKRP